MDAPLFTGTSDPDVTVDVDGVATSIGDCAWIEVAPCGCVSGVMSARGHGRRDPITTVEQCAKAYVQTAAQRKKLHAEGFRFALVGREDATARMREGCAHDPQFGVEPRPEPEGWTWAVRGSRPRVVHLVPAAAVRAFGAPLTIDRPKGGAACAPAKRDYWRSEETDRIDCTDCATCTRLARANRLPAHG